ncbi:MAG: Mrp/NBP35 family ATP-binding protein [Deltaproteobacteria bacterium]|nr:Mrp/NBP35 family ATP-binding protein [Deltaproteobacteria bacterium]MCB9788842.1 Mrp/NBP35 family ATP-binding protein [Deltaproteobacteria bacterium]
MASITVEQVMQALRGVDDPDLRKDIVTLNMARDVRVEGQRVSLRLVLTTPACPLKDRFRADIEAALRPLGVTSVEVEFDAEVRKAPGAAPQGGQPGAAPTAPRMPDVKAVIAVASGKGGVGKSTVATNLAVSLARTGARVGLLDADIYGPSMPVMLGLRGARPTIDEKLGKIIPLERHGLKVMSMGFMLEEADAVVWRGPMLGKALQQFIEDVLWGELDYVVVDMPPGTGDVQLSLAQLLPVAGAVVVTTPQDVAFADVRRAIRMFEMTRTRVLGLVENMSHFVCPSCGADHQIFGASRIDAHAEAHGLEVLGRLPLDAVTAVAADAGEPIVIAEPDSPAAAEYARLAGQVAQKLAILTHGQADPTSKFAAFFQGKPG